MIKFFRKIRKDLLSRDKTGKYFKYAIGEIILVVFGILIALQINNWNNNQKEKQAELKFLSQIKNSLEGNGLILEKRIELDKRFLNEGKLLYEYIKTQKKLNDSIKKKLIFPQYDQMVSFNITAFENLKNEGLSFISNDDLKFEIMNIYDQELKYIQNIFANQFENYIMNVINPFYSKNFEINLKENLIVAEPNDYQKLIKNKEFTNIISMVNTMRTYAISNYQNTQIKIKDILIKLEKEIKILNE